MIADICARLDGLPLAIELAAARTRAFPIAQISSRLNDRFRLLTGGSRTALPRQQTLRAVVDWSYELLFDDEQRVFERLSVFPGGCDLATAEAVCADETIAAADIADHLHALVDKSLVVAVPRGDRAAVHATPDARGVRQGEADRTRRRGAHRATRWRRHYAELCAESAAAFTGDAAASVADRDRSGARQPQGRARLGGRQRRRGHRADDRRRRQLAALAAGHGDRRQALARRRLRVRGRARPTSARGRWR